VAGSIEGQTVRVTSKGSHAGQPTLSFYAVAEPDPTKAEAIVRDEIGAAPDDLIEAIKPLSDAEVAALGLNPGQFERL
jgi:hypothetical protein